MAKTVFEHGTIVTPDFLNAVNNQTNTGTANDGDAPKVKLQDIDGFEHSSHTMPFGDFTAGDELVTFHYSIFYPYNVGGQGLVFLWFKSLSKSGAPDSGLYSKGSGTTVLPEKLHPVSDIYVPVSVIVAGVHGIPGVFKITSGGIISFGRLINGVDSPGWSGNFLAGNKGWDQFVVHYPVNLV
ncbi:MAG TPA: hypothetical protein VHO70_18950 [Chitinispirillaceae bacterium]|nr:hypothetical protein [Chitinispirillaceae bacterium]